MVRQTRKIAFNSYGGNSYGGIESLNIWLVFLNTEHIVVDVVN